MLVCLGTESGCATLDTRVALAWDEAASLRHAITHTLALSSGQDQESAYLRDEVEGRATKGLGESRRLDKGIETRTRYLYAYCCKTKRAHGHHDTRLGGKKRLAARAGKEGSKASDEDEEKCGARGRMDRKVDDGRGREAIGLMMGLTCFTQLPVRIWCKETDV